MAVIQAVAEFEKEGYIARVLEEDGKYWFMLLEKKSGITYHDDITEIEKRFKDNGFKKKVLPQDMVICRTYTSNDKRAIIFKEDDEYWFTEIPLSHCSEKMPTLDEIEACLLESGYTKEN